MQSQYKNIFNHQILKQLINAAKTKDQTHQFIQYYQLLGQQYIKIIILDTLINHIKDSKLKSSTNQYIVLKKSNICAKSLCHDLPGTALYSIGKAFNQNDKTMIKSIKKKIKQLVNYAIEKHKLSLRQDQEQTSISKNINNKNKQMNSLKWGSFQQNFQDMKYPYVDDKRKPNYDNVLKELDQKNQVEECKEYEEYDEGYGQDQEYYHQQASESYLEFQNQGGQGKPEVYAWYNQEWSSADQHSQFLINQIDKMVVNDSSYYTHSYVSNDKNITNMKKSNVKQQISPSQEIFIYLNEKIKDLSTEMNYFYNFVSKRSTLVKQPTRSGDQFHHKTKIEIVHSLTNLEKVKFQADGLGKSTKQARDHSYYKIMLQIFNKLPQLFKEYLLYKKEKGIKDNDR